MHRVLIKIGSFAIYSWGFMVALGFAVAIWVSSRRAKKRGFKPDIVLDFGVVVILASLIGGRLWYVVTHINEFRGHWFDIINPYHHGVFGIAGMAMVGGVILGIIAAFLFCKVKRINFLTLGDIVAPTFLLGMFIGRWGCFLNGCCFGRPCNLPWCVVFPSGSPAGDQFPGISIHPTELYEGFLDLAAFLILITLEKKGKKFRGWSFWMTFIFYGIIRAIVDYFRYYDPSEIFMRYLGGNLSVHGFVALCIALFSAFMIVFSARANKKAH